MALLNELRYASPDEQRAFVHRMATLYVAMNEEMCNADLRATDSAYAELAQEETLDDLEGNYTFALWLCQGEP